ncbi:hypothetical protein ACFFLS_12265 [Flavobacterium procerum]|uniref:Uncharacterized protein n=1 Tax=Flavobacterium procerum TaxID=1455569 RepID=A0ABV6BQV5_9FLAO
MEKEELLVFNGQLAWNGKEPKSSDITAFFNDKKNVLMTKFIDSTLGYHDPEILELFHLSYSHTINHFKKGIIDEQYPFTFENCKIKKNDAKNFGITQWIASNTDLAYFLAAYSRMELGDWHQQTR